jgi:hypothetical protein
MIGMVLHCGRLASRPYVIDRVAFPRHPWFRSVAFAPFRAICDYCYNAPLIYSLVSRIEQ